MTVRLRLPGASSRVKLLLGSLPGFPAVRNGQHGLDGAGAHGSSSAPTLSTVQYRDESAPYLGLTVQRAATESRAGNLKRVASEHQRASCRLNVLEPAGESVDSFWLGDPQDEESDVAWSIDDGHGTRRKQPPIGKRRWRPTLLLIRRWENRSVGVDSYHESRDDPS